MAALSKSDTIKKLPDQTIRLISAGEVITRPFNVVKELVENSIDAGAHNIRVSIDQGGLKTIEVVDNGHGISKANGPLLCQRYTTSKLEAASDLQRITTFGFRGEALSSISEVAEIEVNSFNIKSDSSGWHGEYKRGDLVKLVDKTITLPGTHIKVRDLFSNTLSRRKSLTSSVLEEKKAIIDLITKLAIHHRDTITFQLNEIGSSELVCSLAPLAFAPCIGSFFGTVMESNLFELTIITDPKDTDPGHRFKSDIHVGFSYKKAVSTLHQSKMILFVNDRLVESIELKREVSALILEFFGSKQYSSLIYISLQVPPTDIDVNTHPAKATITLHYQQEIIALILTKLRAKFNENLSSQIVPNQAMLRQRTIGELIKHSSSQASPSSEGGINQERLRRLAPGSLSQSSPSAGRRPYEQVHNDCNQPNLSQVQARPSRARRELGLKSLAKLRARVADEKTPDELSVKTIKNSTFVGIFDHHRALIQHETKLFAINLKSFLREQFYQFYLFDFGNFPAIEILPPGNKINFMVETHLEHLKKHEPEKFDKLSLKTPEAVVDELLEHADMFEDYLKMKITRQEILTIPNVIPEHVPNLAHLGQFLVSMANNVDYTNELDCFHQMGRAIADFYSNPPVLVRDLQVQRRYHEFVEMRLYDAIRRYLILPDWLITKQNICQITDTKDLYKVFERC